MPLATQVRAVPQGLLDPAGLPASGLPDLLVRLALLARPGQPALARPGLPVRQAHQVRLARPARTVRQDPRASPEQRGPMAAPRDRWARLGRKAMSELRDLLGRPGPLASELPAQWDRLALPELRDLVVRPDLLVSGLPELRDLAVRPGLSASGRLAQPDLSVM